MNEKTRLTSLQKCFLDADNILMKKYISKLSEFPIIKANENISKIRFGSNISLYHIDKIVYDKNENIHDKLTSVYTALPKNNSLVLMLVGEIDHTDLYIGVVNRIVNQEGKVISQELSDAGDMLVDVFNGNFPGTSLRKVDVESNKSGKGIIDKSFDFINVISAVSSIASLKNKNEYKSKSFVQGMEKLVDSMRGKKYVALYIADLLDNDILDELCAGYEELYSQLYPYLKSDFTYNKNMSVGITESETHGEGKTINSSLAKTIAHSTTSSTSNSFSFSKNQGINIGPIKSSINIGYTRAKTKMESDTEANSTSFGISESLTKQNSIANSMTSGTGESMQISYENRTIKSLLEKIDENISRIKECRDFGIFDSCVYFMSARYDDTIAAANAYRSLIRGENSSAEVSAINTWVGKKEEDITSLLEYLKRFYHPIFELALENLSNEENIEYIPVTPALKVSGKELAYQFSLPKKSLSGLPVIECAEFGRNIVTVDNEKVEGISVGNIYHMHHKEETKVNLSLKELASHVFVTGSTGSGKSNVIYQLLTKINKNSNATFMVIEPAKGEYKDVFGLCKNIKVDVYGTNPKMTPLLKINPFKFPTSVHIYEHMERLIEIFNVCWPMYAAMPALLKKAIEQAYISTGWDLENSENKTGERVYPTFESVTDEIRLILNQSEYSEENKSNYKGALLTRLESLTNGLNRLIFTSDDISDEKLFDRNVIVDISRIGSSETKSLIMGILIMKLHEYRSCTNEHNSMLKHVTVLEEAHNLLKKTNFEQNSEGANLLGKSVEMLSNSIAEMRTYGEGFIIADQAPGLMDMSVIRNTNTKIILRLPDYEDRELVGKASGLNADQINELAKLKTGVAAVYQNNWISPVLCQFDEYLYEKKQFLKPEQKNIYAFREKDILKLILKANIRKKIESLEDPKSILNKIVKSELKDSLKINLIDLISNKNRKFTSDNISKLTYDLFGAEKILLEAMIEKNIVNWRRKLINNLTPSVKKYSDEEIDFLLSLLVKEQYRIDMRYEDIYLSFMEYLKKKSVENKEGEKII